MIQLLKNLDMIILKLIRSVQCLQRKCMKRRLPKKQIAWENLNGFIRQEKNSLNTLNNSNTLTMYALKNYVT